MRNPSPQKATTAAALRRNYETSPLYTIPASAKGLAECRIHYQPDGVIALEYLFRDGDWPHVRRDASIEYTELDARFTLNSNERPEAILAHAERAVFGAEGCGMDWRQPETRPADEDPGLTEAIFRGEVCNCQARLRRNKDNPVVWFNLRSAC
ncbi:MAG: hypothetical protein L0Y43_02010 [Methylococcaceae bacterium]|nr:hypothetical protein [Methylococcaceae bacterium]